MFIGTVISLIVFWESRPVSTNLNGVVIERNEYGKGSQVYDFKVKIDNEISDVRIDLKERRYTKDETDKLFISIKKVLMKEILFKNSDFEHVNSNLKLINKLDGYPFKIRWDIQNSEVINQKGEILYENISTYNVSQLLKCILTYEEYSYELDIPIIIVKPQISQTDILMNKINQLLVELDNELITYKDVYLPTNIDGKKIQWYEKRDFKPVYIFAGSILMAIISMVAIEFDENRKKEEQIRAMEEIYPKFVDKLRLYMISGINMKKAFENIYRDFLANSSKGYKYVSEHLKKTNNYFLNGIPEEKIYEEFGNNCGGSYKKLAFLLIVNLKQGNDKLLSMLELETIKAMQIRKEQIKRKADIISVKLLFPMIIMLLVVLLMIMLPAYYEFN